MNEPHIALLSMDSKNDYQVQLQQDFERTTRRLGLRPRVYHAEGRAETQVQQIRTLLLENDSTRPKALLVCPVIERELMSLVHDAARTGIAWVMLSRWNDAMNGFRHQYPKVPIFAVLPDQEEIGQIQGQQLHHLLAPGDELVYIQGPISTFTSRRRCVGIEKALAGKHDFHWVRFNADWSQAAGEVVMESWLSQFAATKLPEFVVASQNDAMAFGALQAIQAWTSKGAGRHLHRGLRVVGCDGSLNFGQRLVITGQLRATVIVPAVSGRAVEEVVSALRFGKQPRVEITVPVQSYPTLDRFTGERKRRLTSEGSAL